MHMSVGTAVVVIVVTVTVMVLLSSGTAGTRISCSYYRGSTGTPPRNDRATVLAYDSYEEGRPLEAVINKQNRILLQFSLGGSGCGCD